MTPPLGIHLSVGVSGAGKTYGVRQAIYAAARTMPIIVIDRMREWTSVPADLAPYTRGVHSVREAKEALREGSSTRLAIVAVTGDLVESVEAACAWARDRVGPAGVAIPEAHRSAPNGAPLPPALEDCATAWRHHRVGLWLDTQRLPLLSRTLTEQATMIRLYAIIGDRDLSIIRSTWGRELCDAVQQCAARYADGEPGWHVALGLKRAPPYVLARDT